jgi:hypothetical protein
MSVLNRKTPNISQDFETDHTNWVNIALMTVQAKSSDKVFGLFFAFLFALLSILSFTKNSLVISVCTCIFSILLILVSVFQPKKLSKLNLAWTKLSYLVSKITSPIVMGVIFVSLFVPISFIGKLRGRDELQLQFKSGPSYWHDVNLDQSKFFSFNNQY